MGLDVDFLHGASKMAVIRSWSDPLPGEQGLSLGHWCPLVVDADKVCMRLSCIKTSRLSLWGPYVHGIEVAFLRGNGISNH